VKILGFSSFDVEDSGLLGYDSEQKAYSFPVF
jgi:hypothetical protein